LRLLHPLMPFITEELWQRLPEGLRASTKSIALAPYPKADAFAADSEATEGIAALQAVVTEVRSQRHDNNVDPKQTVEGILYARDGALKMARSNAEAIARLARVNLELRDEAYPGVDAPFVLKLKLKVDREKLLKENEQLAKLVANIDRQLANEDFMAKAPEKVIAGLRQKRAEYQAQIDKNNAALGE
jgi:valyl-tRNA synthetase